MAGPIKESGYTPEMTIVAKVYGVSPTISQFPQLEQLAREELGWDDITVAGATGDEMREALSRKGAIKFILSQAQQ